MLSKIPVSCFVISYHVKYISLPTPIQTNHIKVIQRNISQVFYPGFTALWIRGVKSLHHSLSLVSADAFLAYNHTLRKRERKRCQEKTKRETKILYKAGELSCQSPQVEFRQCNLTTSYGYVLGLQLILQNYSQSRGCVMIMIGSYLVLVEKLGIVFCMRRTLSNKHTGAFVR